jgi:hypothetical protein
MLLTSVGFNIEFILSTLRHSKLPLRKNVVFVYRR